MPILPRLRSGICPVAVRARDSSVRGSRITGYFHSPSMLVSVTQPLNFDELIRIFNDRVEQFTQRGSGYVLSNIIKLSMIYVTFLHLGGGSSYIPTPKFIAKKRAVVNVKSHGTDCFCWAVLAALYPARRNTNRSSSYECHRDAINCSVLLFPVHPFRTKQSPYYHSLLGTQRQKKTPIPFCICRQTCTDAPTRFRCYYSTIRLAVIANITSGSKISPTSSRPNTHMLTPDTSACLVCRFLRRAAFCTSTNATVSCTNRNNAYTRAETRQNWHSIVGNISSSTTSIWWPILNVF